MENETTRIEREVDNQTLTDQIEELKVWILNQPKIPKLSEKTLELFLHSCIYDVSATKQTLLAYYKLRMEAPFYFTNRDPCSASIRSVIKSAYCFLLPGTTEKGYKVILCGYLPYNENFNFKNTMKRFMMLMDMWLSKMEACAGFVILMDSQYTSLPHYTSVSFDVLKKLVAYFQEALPVRLKSIIFVNIATTTNLLLTMAQPILSKKICDMIQKFTIGDDGYLNFVPKNILPHELGGNLGTIAKWSEAAQKDLEDYAEWFMEQNEIIKSLSEKN